MDLQRKIEYVASAVISISRHDDEDVAVRSAALDKVDEIIKAERARMAERVQDRIAEKVCGGIRRE